MTKLLTFLLLFASLSCSAQLGGFVGGSTASNNQVLALQLPKWRLALAKARSGGGDAKLMFVGDSTTGGFNTAQPSIAYTYPTQLMTMFTAGETPVATSQGFSSDIQLYPPSAWTLPSGWTLSAFNGVQAAPGCTSFVYTPSDGHSYDSFDIYYLGSSGLGAVLATATGGTGVALNGNQATSGIYKTTVTAASASTSNSLTLSNCQTANSFITNIEPFLSTTSRVRFANFGIAGSTTTNWVNTTPAFYQITGMTAYAPNLTIIMLGINDAAASTPCATTIANLQTIITAAKISGDVILNTVFPSSGTTLTNEQACYPSYISLAATNNIPLIDVFGRFGAVAQPAAYTGDGIHPTTPGYLDMAAAVWQTLKAVQ